MNPITRIAAALALTLGLTLGLPCGALAAGGSISGEVKKIDEGAGKITLKHGPAKSLGMEEPMTMVYRVKDAAMLKQVKVGDLTDKTAIGPVASKTQFDKIQGLIQKGIDEGATVVVGGPGRPDGLDTGY